MQIGLLIESLAMLDDVAEWGFHYAEIVPSLLGPDADDPAAEATARARILAARVPAATMCGFLPDPHNLGLMVFGSGTARTIPPGFPRDQGLAQLREFVGMCADLAEPRGLKVVIEPQNRTDTNLIHTVPEGMRIVEEVNRDCVRVMADFFHMRLNDEPLDDLIAAGPNLLHGHIAEPGRGWPQTTSADHAAFFQTLRQAGFDGRVSQTGPLPAYASRAEAAETLKTLASGGVAA